MTSEDIRARIAQLEAEAEQRAQAEAAQRSQPAGQASPDDDADPWQRLFDTPWLDPAGLEGDDFSLNGWLAEGLRGLRACAARRRPRTTSSGCTCAGPSASCCWPPVP